MTKVITYGTYDVLHYGHINLLTRAKALGDYLIVGVTSDNYDRFLALVNKYVDIPELTQTMVNEFIQKIIVYAPFQSEGHRVQNVEIVFNFVGKVEIPILTEPVILERISTQKKTA